MSSNSNKKRRVEGGRDPFVDERRVPDALVRCIVGMLLLCDVVRWRRTCRAWARRPWSWFDLRVIHVLAPSEAERPNVLTQLTRGTLGDVFARAEELYLTRTWCGMSYILPHCRRLRVLDVRDHTGWPDQCFLAAFDLLAAFKIPTLTHVHMDAPRVEMYTEELENAIAWRSGPLATVCAPLVSLKLPSDCIEDPLVLPTSLETLEVRAALSPRWWSELLRRCPRLRDLKLHATSESLPMECAVWLDDGAQAWRHVHLNESDVQPPNRSSLTDSRFHGMLRAFLRPTLETFALQENVNVLPVTADHAWWADDIPTMPLLRELTLRMRIGNSGDHENAQCNSAFLRSLYQRMPRLETWPFEFHPTLFRGKLVVARSLVDELRAARWPALRNAALAAILVAE